MIGLAKTTGKLAAAAVTAASFLTSAIAPARPSRADGPPQDAAQVEIKVEVRKEAVTKTVKVAAPAGAVEAANLDPLAQQWAHQLRPILRAELRLLTSAADPSPAQRREIAIEGGRKLKEVAGTMVGKLLNRQDRADPRESIQGSIRAASQARLSPEQFERYRKEFERKARDRKEAVVLNLVANLDKLVVLGVEQRARICDALRSNWDDRAYPSPEMSGMYDAYFPTVMDRHISSILTAEQRNVWWSAPKLNFASFRGANFNNGMAMDPDDGEEDADVAAALEEAKR